jgi:hypothetical protein
MNSLDAALAAGGDVAQTHGVTLIHDLVQWQEGMIGAATFGAKLQRFCGVPSTCSIQISSSGGGGAVLRLSSWVATSIATGFLPGSVANAFTEGGNGAAVLATDALSRKALWLTLHFI